MTYEAHLFVENVQNCISISKMQEENRVKIFLSEIIASEHLAVNCLC